MNPRGHGLRGEAAPGAKLTEASVRAIRKAYDDPSNTETMESLGCRYGVSSVAIWKVINFMTWGHVE